MKNKFSYIGLLINITIFIVFSIKSPPIFADRFPKIVGITGFFYFFIIAIIIVVILWGLIRLSRKRSESKPLFLANCILAVFNSFSLLYPILMIFFFMIFGTGDSS